MAPSYRALWRQDKSLDFLTAARRLASQTCVCPIVSLECLWDQDEKFLNSLYQQGIALSKKAMQRVESRLERHPELPKWDMLSRPVSAL